MRQIDDALNGQKMVFSGQWQAKRGQQQERALQLIESALIKHALAAGHELFNIQGTRSPVHTINSTGNREASTHLFLRVIKEQAR